MFPLESPVSNLPVQTVTASTTRPPLVADISPTKQGNALVAAITIATFGAHIDTITDDAGNQWMRALDGVDNSMGPGRVEIWYVLDAASITSCTLGIDKGVAIDLMEWEHLAPAGTPTQAHAAVELAPATTISTGPLETQTAGLVIGMASCAGTNIPADLMSTEFTEAEFLDVETSPTSAGNVAFAVAERGSHEITWTRGAATACTAGIVAIPAAP